MNQPAPKPGTRNDSCDSPESTDWWNGFWHAEVPPFGQAAFRILFGLFLLGYLAPLCTRVGLLFSDQGIYVPFLFPLEAPSFAVAWLLYLFLLGALVLFTLGAYTRLVTPVLLGLFSWHWCLNLAIKDTAYDRLIVTLLALCCFAHLDGAWSVTAWWRERTGRELPARVSGWAARLIMVQLALLYFGSGLYKLLTPAWHSGEVLRLYLTGPWASPVAFGFVGMGWAGWVYDGLAWFIIGFELLAGFALFTRRFRGWFMVLGSGFHLGVWIFLTIPEFMFCVGVYPLFLDPRSHPGRPGGSLE